MIHVSLQDGWQGSGTILVLFQTEAKLMRTSMNNHGTRSPSTQSLTPLRHTYLWSVDVLLLKDAIGSLKV